MFKTKFNDNETKALIANYYEKYEGKKVESVAILPRVVKDDEFVKSTKTSVAFVVNCVEDIDGFEKTMEEYLDIDMVCGYMTKYFEDRGYRDVLISVRSDLAEEAYEPSANETVCNQANFEGLVFEYDHKEDLTKVADGSEDLSSEEKTTSTKSTRSKSAQTLEKKKGSK